MRVSYHRQITRPLSCLVFISEKHSREEGRITIDDHENFIKKDYDKYLLAGLWQVMSFSFVFLVFFFII